MRTRAQARAKKAKRLHKRQQICEGLLSPRNYALLVAAVDALIREHSGMLAARSATLDPRLRAKFQVSTPNRWPDPAPAGSFQSHGQSIALRRWTPLPRILRHSRPGIAALKVVARVARPRKQSLRGFLKVSLWACKHYPRVW